MERRAPYASGPPLHTFRETLVVRETTRRSMKANRSKNTAPEVLLRQCLFAAGLRGYRCNDTRLPGTPDIWVPRAQLAVFVHGCFWHGHGCRLSTTPSTNRAFWLEKVRRNRERHARVTAELRQTGTTVVTIWECQLKGDLANVSGCLLNLIETLHKLGKMRG